jgi:hypothetical protein
MPKTVKTRALAGTPAPQAEGKRTSQRLKKILREYLTYMAKVKAAGQKVRTHKAPCCGGVLECLVPPKGDTWDTLMACPYCDGRFFKVATSTKIVTHIPPEFSRKEAAHV